MDFDALFNTQLDQLKEEGNYRYFAELERKCGKFPRAANHADEGLRDCLVFERLFGHGSTSKSHRSDV